jgi:hypothetical protein
MKLLQPRRAHFERVAALVEQPKQLVDIHADTDVPDEVVRWLNRLKRLYGVPFNYLVADEELLPTESIRFFSLDLNWLYALVEGAYSIGRQTKAVAAHDAVLGARVHAKTTPPTVSPAQAEAVGGGPAKQQVTGFLLRSGVVSGWPGLEVTAYDSTNTLLTPPLRMERLAPTILLFMVAGVIHHVDLHEPAEGLHFGIDQESNTRSLRWVTVPATAPAKTRPGDQVLGATPVGVQLRSGRVVKVDQLAKDVKTALDTAHANDDPNSHAPRAFTTAELALELVEGVEAVRFVNDA